MFTNLQHLPAITQEQHRALPFVSNTDLSNLADELLGRLRVVNGYTADALTFGSHFHSAILEPEQFQAIGQDLAGRERSQWATAGELARAIKRHRYPRHVCYLGQAEQSYTATHEATGLTVKVRPDLLIDSPQKRRRTLVDFKTTSCKDLAQFLETVDKYGYDRQGALYADALGAHRVVLIGQPRKREKPQPTGRGSLLCVMLTYSRHRYLTRWNRRAVFAVAVLLLLALSWRAYRAWQRAHPHTPEQRGQLV
jgi:hypothetical protein